MDTVKDMTQSKFILPRSQKVFYGVGHILNDLCANCWFSYVLIYMTKIAGLSESNAGLVLLIGQLADALFTLIIGYSCDKTKITWYGKRKFWHGIGTICVLISFPFVFNLCINCSNSSAMIKLAYYSAFVIAFQFGWAATQIAHLSLIPDITSKESQRVELNAIRSGLTFACGIFVYGTTWLLLGTTDGDMVDSSVSKQFMILAFIVIGTGFVFSLIFHIGTKEERYVKVKTTKTTDKYTPSIENITPISSDGKSDVSVESANSGNTDKTVVVKVSKGRTWKAWLKDSRLYKTALMYMSTRLAINVFQSYFALYLTDALHFKKEAIAYFPLIVLIAGSVTSFFLKFVTKKIGSQLTYVVGALMIIGSSIWLFSVGEEHREAVYGAAWLAGSGSSIILVTALAKTAELIGTDKRSSAFVYSAMSFTEKLATGIVIFTIQSLKPSAAVGVMCQDCEVFSKIVQTVVPGASVLLGLFAIVFLFPSEFTCVRKSNLLESNINSKDSVLTSIENSKKKLSGDDEDSQEQDIYIVSNVNNEESVPTFTEKSNMKLSGDEPTEGQDIYIIPSYPTSSSNTASQQQTSTEIEVVEN